MANPSEFYHREVGRGPFHCEVSGSVQSFTDIHPSPEIDVTFDGRRVTVRAAPAPDFDSFDIISVVQSDMETTERHSPSATQHDESFLDRLRVTTLPSSHFIVSDIQTIGNRILGLRHVSSPEHAQYESTNGMLNGCSLNLSFNECEHKMDDCEKDFIDLHTKIEFQDPQEIQRRITKYEDAINNFVEQSIHMDLQNPCQPVVGMKIGTFLETINKVRFLVIHYPPYEQPTDCCSYGGLGRIPKTYVQAENISPLIPLAYNFCQLLYDNRDEIIESIEVAKEVYRIFTDHYRQSLLNHIRK